MAGVRALVENSLTAELNRSDREAIAAAFPALGRVVGHRGLALRPFLRSRPESFYCRRVFAEAFSWLEQRKLADPQGLQALLVDSETELNTAFLTLRELNAAVWHDHDSPNEKGFETIRFMDTVLHPAYQKLTEAVLTPFTRPMAYFSRLDRGKSPDKLDTFNIKEELDGHPLEALFTSYHHLLRNGIAHGGVTFGNEEATYRDKRGNTADLPFRAVRQLVDDLLDTCNGLAAAFKAFFILEMGLGNPVPREILVEELAEETTAPWWRIDGCVETTIPGQTQLMVLATASGRNLPMIRYSAIQTGILAEELVEGYGRYFVGVRGENGWPGFLAFDGPTLRDIREAGPVSIADYAPAAEEKFMMFIPGPKMGPVRSKIDIFRHAYRVVWPRHREEIRRSMGRASILFRHGKIHRSRWGSVIWGGVVMTDFGDQDPREVVWSHRRRILASVRSQSESEPGKKASWFRRLPVGFAQIAVFRKDFRARRLASFGLGEDLICTVRLHRNRVIRSPDIRGSEVEQRGSWRIAWNRAWIDDGVRVDV